SANDESGTTGGFEDDTPDTWRFSIEVAKRWEQALDDTHLPYTRKVKLRSAMTMSPDKGGVFDTLLALVRFGLGGTAGSGRQFVSWIHEQDFVRALTFLIERDDLEGVVNLSSPLPIPNREFMDQLRRAWGARIGLPSFEWMLEIGAVLLRTETELILKSRRVVPGRLVSAGFRFDFPDWEIASKDLVSQWRNRHDR